MILMWGLTFDCGVEFLISHSSFTFSLTRVHDTLLLEMQLVSLIACLG